MGDLLTSRKFGSVSGKWIVVLLRCFIESFRFVSSLTPSYLHCVNNIIPYTIHKQSSSKLPPEVNRILYVRNLPFTISADELYAIFGKYGAVYQIRLGHKDKDTRGTAFVVYEDIYDAKAAVDHLSGFNVGGRYLVVLYYQPAKFQKRAEVAEQQKELQVLRKKVAQQQQQQQGK